ncbi:MAG: AAA-like domain-containing protein, partial [Chloroflexi bacterium]|nr:AAA-like domain-containing protein [Chloroflexota bacterium]
MIAELEAESQYFGMLLDFETLRGYTREEFYRWLHQQLLDSWRIQRGADDPTLEWLATVQVTEHNGFGRLLRQLGERVSRGVVLIIDEFDAIGAEHAVPILAVFREMYLNRNHPALHSLHSLILVGVRNIPSLLGGTQSPFNIADQFTVPYFTPAEVADLLSQHTAESDQPFAPEVIAAIARETEGQP